MHLSSRNRLLYSKQAQNNTRSHHLKLEQIKQSKPKEQTTYRIDNLKGRLQKICYPLFNTEKQRQIDKDNTLLYARLSMIIDKPIKLSRSVIPRTKLQRVIREERKPPNTDQKSFYSIQKLQSDWKQHKGHVRIASRMYSQRHPFTKQKHYLSKQLPESQRLFEEKVQLFEDLCLLKSDEHISKPEELAERIIIVKKTKQINEISYLIQISTGFNQIFLLAYNLHGKNQIFRSTISMRKARRMFAEYNYDFQQIISNILIEENKIYLQRKDKSENVYEDTNRESNCNGFQRSNIYRDSYSLMLGREREKQIHQSKRSAQLKKDLSFSKQLYLRTNSKRYDEIRMKQFSTAVTMKKKNESERRLNNSDIVPQTVQKNFRIKEKSRKSIMKQMGARVNSEEWLNGSDSQNIQQEKTDIVMDLKERQIKSMKIIQFLYNNGRYNEEQVMEKEEQSPEYASNDGKRGSSNSEEQQNDDFSH